MTQTPDGQRRDDRRKRNVEEYLGWHERLILKPPRERVTAILTAYPSGIPLTLIGKLMGLSRKKTKGLLHKLKADHVATLVYLVSDPAMFPPDDSRRQEAKETIRRLKEAGAHVRLGVSEKVLWSATVYVEEEESTPGSRPG